MILKIFVCLFACFYDGLSFPLDTLFDGEKDIKVYTYLLERTLTIVIRMGVNADPKCKYDRSPLRFCSSF